MNVPNVPKSPTFLVEKINRLCNLLVKEKDAFEEVATSTTNNDLRSTMLMLAQESKQYTSELCSQLQCLGGVPVLEKNTEFEVLGENRNLVTESQIQSFCKSNETKVISAYQEILNDSSIYEGLRKMISYQLNAILCAFTHVKQLNAVKFH